MSKFDEAMAADWNFLAMAVELKGGIASTAKFLAVSQKFLKSCLLKGTIPPYYAKRLAPDTKIAWQLIAYSTKGGIIPSLN